MYFSIWRVYHESAWHWPEAIGQMKRVLASATHSVLTLQLKCTLEGRMYFSININTTVPIIYLLLFCGILNYLCPPYLLAIFTPIVNYAHSIRLRKS